MVDSKILDTAPITEREDWLLRAARAARPLVESLRHHHGSTNKTGDCISCLAILQLLDAALALYRDRP